MAKLKHDTIAESDLTEYLEQYSDFAFELQILNDLIAMGFQCQHGGLYEDFRTKKQRQYDIRATKSDGCRVVRLAVECKNIRPYYPLLVSCVPRRTEECYWEVVCAIDSRQPASDALSKYALDGIQGHPARTLRIDERCNIYLPGDFVGKSCGQVGRDSNGIISSDSDVFTKWTQALGSAEKLASLSWYDAREQEKPVMLSSILPVLVVSDGMLWTAEFESTGARRRGPRKCDRCPYFIDAQLAVGRYPNTGVYTVSHIEFVTRRGLADLTQELSFDCLFPSHLTDQLRRMVSERQRQAGRT